jgi:hypothetical protein
VDWLGFDPVQNAFHLDPYRYCPWFAGRNIPNLPDPGPAGSREKLLLEGMDPAKRWDYVLRVYVPQEKTVPLRNQ